MLPCRTGHPLTDLHDFRPDYGDVWDSYERMKADDFVEHLHALAQERNDRLREHRPAKPDPKPAPRITRRDAALRYRPALAWKLTVLERDQGCCVHSNPADCSDGWVAHHVVAQQELRRSRPDLLWNPLSGMGVCGLAHRQHHNRVRPITQDEIPAAVLVFLREAGYSWYLDRHYEILL